MSVTEEWINKIIADKCADRDAKIAKLRAALEKLLAMHDIEMLYGKTTPHTTAINEARKVLEETK